MSNFDSEQAISATLTSTDDPATRFLNRVLRRYRSNASHRQSSRPWESWELNEEFFKALSQWTMRHPETSLDRALDDMRNGLEHSKDLLSLIPDSPFPARGLVTALAYLFKLGVTISRAQQHVYDFGKDVVRWVGEVRMAFRSSEDGRFTRSTWHNLKHMRKLIDEICSWAFKRLEDRRWSRIGHGLKIQGEIQEFNERISNARALFQTLSAINTARGLDAILADLRRLLYRESIIVHEIKQIRVTQETQLTRIVDGSKKQELAAERERFLENALAGHTVADPTYDKQGKRPCDPDTRVEVLAEVNSWISNISPGTENFLWLTGDPGCGKSAVTASIAKECKRENKLWAQFFINRNNAETTDPNLYFPSIASQLARRSPEVAEVLQAALTKDRTLTDAISADQAARLFISSVQCASLLDTKIPVVVVIDGLDETDWRRLQDTATIFSTIFPALEAYSNVKILISSRTENAIQKSFVLPLNDKHVKRIHLDTSHLSSIQDVSRYIKRNLGDLVKEHDLNWDVWPGNERAEALGWRASGLFIWGVTAVKFIEEQLYSDGKECLNEVLDMLTVDVLDDINALYMLILEITHRGRQSEWELERFRRIVGAIMFLQEPICINDLATLLDLRKGPSSEPVDIVHFIRRFRTILVPGTDAIDGHTIPRIHISLLEFITSQRVDPRFHVDPNCAHLELAIQCLTYLRVAPKLVIKDMLPVPFRYASRFWSTHLSQFGHMSVCADDRQSTSPSPPSYAVSLISSAHDPVQIQYSAPTSQVSIVASLATVWDETSGAVISRHTNVVTCIVFSPDRKRILSCSRDKTIIVWDSANGGWIRTLVKHSSEFNAVAFSPDARFIISGSNDGLVHCWEYSTGAPLGKPFRGHKERVTCIAISYHGDRIVSGSKDTTCILWNAQNGRIVGQPWTGHEFPLDSIAFSGSGRRVCSMDDQGNCLIWDVSTGQKTSNWHYGGIPRCMSFSPQDDDVVAVGGSDGVKIRSKDQMWLISSSDTLWLSFSPDGKEIIFSTFATVSIAEVGKDDLNARIMRRGSIPYTTHITASAFSSGFGHFAWADEENSIHLFSLVHDDSSLKAVLVDAEMRTTKAVKNCSIQELERKFTGMKKARRISASMTNRRLDGITWYEVASDGNVGESVVKACVVRDDVVISGFNDDAVCVWERQGVDDEQSISMVSFLHFFRQRFLPPPETTVITHPDNEAGHMPKSELILTVTPPARIQ